ncbi:MAG: permease [Deltaproteobacteria bacterium RBG_16_71_12]|nr:MAG: permease [Deltaproteobacteria bacterium RBG_16_71_12]
MTALPALLLCGAMVAQAIVPRRRVAIVLLAAALAVLETTIDGRASMRVLVGGIPWDVLILLVALGALSELFRGSRLFERLAVAVVTRGGANPTRLVLMVAVLMYVASAFVNNLTALLLVMPVLLVLLRLVGTTQRHLTWTVAVMLVACNLGGAATPIGDFPAILLLGAGAMSFNAYLAAAAPLTLLAMAAFLIVVTTLVRPASDVPQSALMSNVTVAVVRALHRNLRVDVRLLLPATGGLALMLATWALVPASTLPPELVAWLGVPLVLLLAGGAGVRAVRAAVDVESTLFLFALFVLVGCVRTTGMFDSMADQLLALPLPPRAQLVVFALAAGLLTGLFSAGPSMAALLVVAQGLAHTLPGEVVYIALALSVCAGSSLFLTAATAGPLAQGMVERALLRAGDGSPIRFGFFEFLKPGALAFVLIEGVAVAWCVLAKT